MNLSAVCNLLRSIPSLSQWFPWSLIDRYVAPHRREMPRFTTPFHNCPLSPWITRSLLVCPVMITARPQPAHPRAYNRVREHNFSLGGLVGFDLHGKTVGVVGTGKIGKITASLFAGFGMRLVVSDAFPDQAWAAQIGATYVPFERLLAESDIVSLHLPLTAQSRHLFNAAAFASMKMGAYIVNTSRGALIDSKALIGALKSGHLGGAALDVYEEEEGVFFEDHSADVLTDDTLARLTTFPNVLITAHQAFLTREALTAIATVTTENLSCLDSGRAFIDGTTVKA